MAKMGWGNTKVLAWVKRLYGLARMSANEEEFLCNIAVQAFGEPKQVNYFYLL